MSYRNPLHGLDALGGPPMSVPGATLPGVTADHTKTTARHPDGEPDRGYTDDDLRTQSDDVKSSAACCDDHDPDGTGVETIQCCERCPLTDADAGLDPGPGMLVLDMAAINQRELERRVAAGEPLPEGVTAEQVAAWHDQYSGPIATIDGRPVNIEVRHG